MKAKSTRDGERRLNANTRWNDASTAEGSTHTRSLLLPRSEYRARPTQLRVVAVLTLALNLWVLPGDAGERSGSGAAERGDQQKCGTASGGEGARKIASSRASLCAARQYSGTTCCLVLWANLRSPSPAPLRTQAVSRSLPRYARAPSRKIYLPLLPAAVSEHDRDTSIPFPVRPFPSFCDHLRMNYHAIFNSFQAPCVQVRIGRIRVSLG